MPAEMTVSTQPFGVDLGDTLYSLRQARYWELANDAALFAQQRFATTGQRTDLLDVGVANGISRRYMESIAGSEFINFHGVGTFPHGRQFVYKHYDWRLYATNLENGLPSIESDAYDIVLCEQVLEHLHHVDLVLTDLARVLKPGGLMILGIPILPHSAYLLQRRIGPVIDRLLTRWTSRSRYRGHAQAWSKRSLMKQIRRRTALSRLRARGFRLVGSGIMRSWEHHRWWWWLNRRIGRLFPSLCIEVQITATKRTASGPREISQPYEIPFPKSQAKSAGYRRAA